LIRAKRNQHIGEFSLSNNYPGAILLGLIFACGLGIVWTNSLLAVTAYLGLWAFSYLVIYAGTCRYCVYYGKKCPIPLEGSCVHHFFEKKDGTFGYLKLFWASAAYGFRVMLPVILIFRYKMTGWGVAYFSVLAMFWIIHLRFTGCPNCINTQCPLNPERHKTRNTIKIGMK
jgi:hypothetical protein